MEENQDLAHFKAIPWCAKHLQGDRIVVETPANALFASTLNTPNGVAAMLPFYTEPQDPKQRVDEVKCLAALGGGLDGQHPGVCHGGLVMALLDEVIGLFVVNQKRRAIPVGPVMTVYLNTQFAKPVSTSSVVLATGRIVRVEGDGRKFYCEGTIEDENGVVLAKADSLFIQLKRKSVL